MKSMLITFAENKLIVLEDMTTIQYDPDTPEGLQFFKG